MVSTKFMAPENINFEERSAPVSYNTNPLRKNILHPTSPRGKRLIAAGTDAREGK